MDSVICCVCGKECDQPYRPFNSLFYGKSASQCLLCFRKIWKKLPERKTATGNYSVITRVIAEKVLTRMSSRRVMRPDEVEAVFYAIASRVSDRPSVTATAAWQYLKHHSGIFRGKSLGFNCDTYEEFPWNRQLLWFWNDIRVKSLNYDQLSLAVLLTILGDKNAITNSAPRNSSDIRRRKAVNSRNNPKHKGRRPRCIAGDGDGGELQGAK